MLSWAFVKQQAGCCAALVSVKELKPKEAGFCD